MKKILFTSLLSVAALANCINISGEFIKMTPPNAKNSAIFMTIKNTCDKDIRLVDAKSEFAKTVELHTHLHENGMMKMVRVKDILVPAKGEAVLKPKSLHVMLFDIKNQVVEDTKVNLELIFDNGEHLKLKNIPSKSVMMHHHK